MRGTIEGSFAEVNFIKTFNSNKAMFLPYLNQFSNDFSDLFLSRVTTKQFSTLSQMLVPTRADAYLIKSKDPNIGRILVENDNLISEDLLLKYNVIFSKINCSGISIKMNNSNFQILKLVPKSFFNLFNSYELGAGASLYVEKSNELYKNNEVILGWNSTFDKMNNVFGFLSNKKINFLTDILECKAIKEFANNEITKLINNSQELQDKIFKGVNLYKEPYTAWYFSDDNKIRKLTLIPFTITTGSGRSKGQYTIVLKPR